LYAFISQVNCEYCSNKEESKASSQPCHISTRIRKKNLKWHGFRLLTSREKISLSNNVVFLKTTFTCLQDSSFQKNVPQGSCIETGGYYICNDIEHECELESWKPYAEKSMVFARARYCLVKKPTGHRNL